MPSSLDPRVSHGIGLLVAGVVAFFSWSAHFRFAVDQYRQTQRQLTDVRQQVEQTDALVAGAGGAAAWMDRQRQQLQAIRQRLPSSHTIPTILDTLVGRVTAASIELVNVNQGNLEPAKDAKGAPMRLDGVGCLGLPVTVTVSGRYQAVVTLLEQVVDATFPCAVRVEQIHLALADPVSGTLTATLVLRLYVLSS